MICSELPTALYPTIMTISLNTHDEVGEALAKNQAVVALESTLITHGLPWPENLDTAKRAEAAVRAEGAVPCTVAIIDGQIRLGLGEQELEALAQTQCARKVSRRDLAIALAKGETGATTVAATMIIAAQAGIEVFATGGIGGVHRGVEHTMDVSADLTELGQTPVTVVCAGAKIILDLPRTLEHLETLGVPVLGFQTQAFPGFFSAETGLQVDESLDDLEDVAKIIVSQRELGLNTGILLTQQPPSSVALPSVEVDTWLRQALDEATDAGVSGKRLTPFLLEAMARHSDGRTLKANTALIENNARLGAQLAVQLASHAIKRI